MILTRLQRFYPAAFAFFPILFLYAHNARQVPFGSLLKALLFGTFLAAAVFGVCRLCLKDGAKAGILTSLVLAVFFSYGHVHHLLHQVAIDAWVASVELHRERFIITAGYVIHGILLAAGLGLAAVAGRGLSRAREVGPLERILAVTATTLLFLSASSALWARTPAVSVPLEEEAAVRPASARPDIYYIMLDGYTRADMLKAWYRYDNGWFLDALRDEGFYVAEKSRSNYAHTLLSLASGLNYRYLDDVLEKSRDYAQAESTFYRMIRENALSRFLKKQGYTIVHVNSTWSATLSNPEADVHVAYSRGLFGDEFLRVLVGSTLLKIADAVMAEDIARTHLYNFDHIPGIARNPAPTFTFAHFVLPHNPYVFDRDGQVKMRLDRFHQWDHLERGEWSDPGAYLEQLIYTSKRVLQMVRDIRWMSPGEEPVIIIQADHGFNLVANDAAANEEIRMAILNAYRVPDDLKSQLYPSITPVNSFRLILNHLFDAGLQKLEDRSFFSPSGNPEALKRVE